MCLKDWHASYHELLEHCHLTELAARRDYLSLSHLFKIIQGSCFFPNAPINRYSNHYLTRSHKRTHFIQPHASCLHKCLVLLFPPHYRSMELHCHNLLYHALLSHRSKTVSCPLASCDLRNINLLFFVLCILFIVYISLFMYPSHLCYKTKHYSYTLSRKLMFGGGVGSTWGDNFYMDTQNGSKLEI